VIDASSLLRTFSSSVAGFAGHYLARQNAHSSAAAMCSATVSNSAGAAPDWLTGRLGLHQTLVDADCLLSPLCGRRDALKLRATIDANDDRLST
jgi:hypothetical protein